MSIGVFKLSLKQRRTLGLVFNALNFLQIIFGLSITVTSIYIVLSFAPILYSERSEINFVFIVTGIYGTHVILHYLMGIKICEKCLNQPQKKSTSGLLLLWTCAGGNILLNFVIICSILRKVSKHIVRSMKHSLQHGMRNYLKEPSWKETIDRLQYQLECCGISGYQDWYDLEWLTKYHYNVNSDVIKKLKSESETNSLEVLPWSCCKVDFPMQCLHDPIQQTQSVHIWSDEPTIVTSSINTEGCLQYLRAPIEKAIICFMISTVLILVFQLFIFLVSRILYTSARNALLLEDPYGVAPGWIFGRGDCGYTGGKSVAEIMAEYETSGETSESSNRSSTPKSKRRPKSHRRSKRNETTSEEGTESNPISSLEPSRSGKTGRKRRPRTSSDEEKV
ncbi:peripherin-2 [Coccinella septempunctata]|uniref:peripherin-2 n=1 Tax=Coccinella septempunctata TaxID=41139 RepID=UPI001D065292|nr:peripherin-2 [Coccinella septempunctata]